MPESPDPPSRKPAKPRKKYTRRAPPEASATYTTQQVADIFSYNKRTVEKRRKRGLYAWIYGAKKSEYAYYKRYIDLLATGKLTPEQKQLEFEIAARRRKEQEEEFALLQEADKKEKTAKESTTA